MEYSEVTQHLVLSEKPIRDALKYQLSKRTGEICYTPIGIIDELEIDGGKARIDIALIDKCIHGYELKSDADNLSRLPRQMHYYSKALDRITLVVGYSLVFDALEMIPSWWGVQVVEKDQKGGITFVVIRDSHNNPNLDPFSMIRLLNAAEVCSVLSAKNIRFSTKSVSSGAVYSLMASHFSLQQIKCFVRQSLLTRTR